MEKITLNNKININNIILNKRSEEKNNILFKQLLINEIGLIKEHIIENINFIEIKSNYKVLDLVNLSNKLNLRNFKFKEEYINYVLFLPVNFMIESNFRTFEARKKYENLFNSFIYIIEKKKYLNKKIIISINPKNYETIEISLIFIDDILNINVKILNYNFYQLFLNNIEILSNKLNFIKIPHKIFIEKKTNHIKTFSKFDLFY